MRRLLIGSILVAGTALLAARSESTGSASGLGNFTFEKDHVGFFDFNVEGGADVSGRLLFAAEGHGDYPDIVVRLDRIRSAQFKGQTVTIKGTGTLQEDTVRVVAVARDGAVTDRPDHFEIKCTNLHGEVVLNASGDVAHGDIHVDTDG